MPVGHVRGVRGRVGVLDGRQELRVGKAEVVDEVLVVRVGARDLRDPALVGHDVLSHNLELLAHLLREGLPFRLLDGLDFRGELLEVALHDLTGHGELHFEPLKALRNFRRGPDRCPSMIFSVEANLASVAVRVP